MRELPQRGLRSIEGINCEISWPRIRASRVWAWALRRSRKQVLLCAIQIGCQNLLSTCLEITNRERILGLLVTTWINKFHLMTLLAIDFGPFNTNVVVTRLVTSRIIYCFQVHLESMPPFRWSWQDEDWRGLRVEIFRFHAGRLFG